MSKILKNKDAPYGRKDWQGRVPRWRVSLTSTQLSIIKEWADDYFLRYPDKKLDQVYFDLYERICEHEQEIQKPLQATVNHFPFATKFN